MSVLRYLTGSAWVIGGCFALKRRFFAGELLRFVFAVEKGENGERGFRVERREGYRIELRSGEPSFTEGASLLVFAKSADVPAKVLFVGVVGTVLLNQTLSSPFELILKFSKLCVKFSL